MRRGKSNVIYMAVTTDEYELPIMWEETAAALARKIGTKPNTIVSSIGHGSNGQKRGFKYIKIELEEEDE